VREEEVGEMATTVTESANDDLACDVCGTPMTEFDDKYFCENCGNTMGKPGGESDGEPSEAAR
jgi:uncharacterized Zn finger protein (UPF0148 family)